MTVNGHFESYKCFEEKKIEGISVNEEICISIQSSASCLFQQIDEAG